MINKKTPGFIAQSSDKPSSSRTGKVKGKRFIVFLIAIFFVVSLGAVAGSWFLFRLYQTLPSLGQMQNIEQSLVSKVFAKDGSLIHEFSVERRFWVSIDKIPVNLQNAVISIEDRMFFKHWGINIHRIFGAVLVNIVRHGYAQGASTLTQQLARNVYLTAESSLIRKIREILTAVQLESCYTKREILELYLNQVYLGAGVYGVEAASEYYFNKHVSELDFNECTILAGLIQLPERYRPDKAANIKRMTSRRNKVIQAMLDMKLIDKETARQTAAIVIEAKHKVKKSGVGAYFTEMVRKYIADRYGDELLYHGGLSIYTTLDPVAQDSAERALEKQILSLQQRLNRIFLDSTRLDKTMKIPRERFLNEFDSIYTANEVAFTQYPDSIKLRKAQMAVVALDVQSGAIRTLIGGRNFNETKFNRIYARRQPGSAFKPFVYTAAMEHDFTPASVVLDQPITLMTDQGEWRPENHERVFYGPITIRNALARSANLVAIQVLTKVGAQVVIDYARRMGLKQQMNPVPSLAIGACEVTPMEMASAYSIYANSGVRATPYYIEKVVDKTGRVLESHTPSEKEVLSPQTAYLMASLMRSVVCCGTGASIPASGFTRPAAGKTGTTDDYSDAWFVGYTPQISCAVWAGVDERRSLGRGVTGSVGAIPVWVKTMSALHKKLPVKDFERPAGIKTEAVCSESHLFATPACPKSENEFFYSETQLQSCDIHGSERKNQNMMKVFAAPQGDKSKKDDSKKKKSGLMF